MALSKFAQNKNEGMKKLTEHYGKLGFQIIDDTGYMALSTYLKVPSLVLDD